MGDVASGDRLMRKIIVAVDESDESIYALKWCLNNIVHNNPNSQYALFLLHAKRPILVYPGLDHSADIYSHDAVASLDRRDREVAWMVIHKAEKLCNAYNVKVEGIVEDGHPRDVICEMVKFLEADLLVMGSHGYSITTRAMLGSVSNDCLQSASCPVLAVKMPKSI